MTSCFARAAAAFSFAMAGLCATGVARASTLDIVRDRGNLRCGVIAGLPGMSSLDSKGEWHGFHVDVCRAMAAAILGDPGKVVFVSVTGQTRFTAVQSGEVDVLESVTALTIQRDLSLGLTQPAVVMYTGQGILVHKQLGAKSLADMNGSTVCVLQGGVIESNLADYESKHKIKLNVVSFETDSVMVGALSSGRCDAASNDVFSLLANRAEMANGSDYVILNEILAKEPHGPIVRAGDEQWAKLMRWVVFSLLQAEELGLTKVNVVQMAQANKDPVVQRFLGSAMMAASEPKLPAGWTVRTIAAVGNYGETYECSVGSGGLKLDRGLNQLWDKGGMMISWLW